MIGEKNKPRSTEAAGVAEELPTASVGAFYVERSKLSTKTTPRCAIY